MSLAIDDIKDILHNTISDGRYRLKAYSIINRSTAKDAIMLFYTGEDNSPLAHSQNISKAVYSRQVEVAVRHKQKDKAQDIAFQAFELLGANRRQNEVSLFFEDSPSFKGIDDVNGGYLYSFILLTRGKK